MIAPNGETHWRDEAMQCRFPVANRRPDLHVKCFLRPAKFQASLSHFPIQFRTEVRTFRNAVGDTHRFDANFGPARSLECRLRYAWIDHFFYKSNQEFLYKLARPRGAQKSNSDGSFKGPSIEFIREFLDLSARPSVKAPTPESKLVAKAAAYKANLLAKPGVAEAQERVISRFEDQVTLIVDSMINSAGFQGLGELGRRFANPLRQKGRSGHQRLDV